VAAGFLVEERPDSEQVAGMMWQMHWQGYKIEVFDKVVDIQMHHIAEQAQE